MARVVKSRWGIGGIALVLVLAGLAVYFSFTIAVASPTDLPALPSAITVRGTDVVCVGIDPNSEQDYGAGRLLQVRFTAGTGPDYYDLQTEIDGHALFTLTFDKTSIVGIGSGSGVFQHRVVSADLTVKTSWHDVTVTASTDPDLTEVVPSHGSFSVDEPGMAPGGSVGGPSSCLFYSGTHSPTAAGVELATGRFRQDFAIVGYGTRFLGVDFRSLYCSRWDYDGPFGHCMSHSYNMILVMDQSTSPPSGTVFTPDLRTYDFQYNSGTSEWELPPGFYSTLELDGDLQRWILTDHAGVQIHFYFAGNGLPCYPVKITEPNENATKCLYDASGRLEKLVTDLDQEIALAYNSGGRLESVTDHLGRSWLYHYDGSDRLEEIEYPSTEYVDLAPGQVVIDTDLASKLVTRRRSLTITYAASSGTLQDCLSILTDDRGADKFEISFDSSSGRAESIEVVGATTYIDYSPSSSPIPLTLLDNNNIIVRVTDGETNITDFEMHGSGGNGSGLGKFGLRRTVTYTETGKGNTELRSNEPDYYERRILQDSDCLTPQKSCRPFSSSSTLSFDSDEMPIDHPTEEFTYNQWRQITEYRLKQGSTVITGYSKAYSDFASYSRITSLTDAGAFETSSVYTGLDFEHTYSYDAKGNLTTHNFPDVTRGVVSTQAASETFEYNAFGQVTKHTEPNGNISVSTYYSGSSVGGSMNSVGQYGGYLESITRGATGSTDAAVNKVTTQRVNSIGMVTRIIDPLGGETDRLYNDMGELTKVTMPEVTLDNAQTRRYESITYYDGAGNAVLSGSTNSDEFGTASSNAYSDSSTGYDAVGRVVITQTEVSGTDSEDVITTHAYDANGLEIAIQYPEGNRHYKVYDERGLLLREFVGIDDNGTILQHYPTRTANSLSGTTYVGVNSFIYDENGNLTKFKDLRGKVGNLFHDALGRLVEKRKQMNDITRWKYTTAGEKLVEEKGKYTAGGVWIVKKRKYFRYDERKRPYQETLDGNVSTDEGDDVDPGNVTGCQPTLKIVYDKGGRQLQAVDAQGGVTTFSYDSMNRLVEQEDDQGNVIKREYNVMSSVTGVEEWPYGSAFCSGSSSYYRAEMTYDELGRLKTMTNKGAGGNSASLTVRFSYNSANRQTTRLDEQENATRQGYNHAGQLRSEVVLDGSTELSRVEYEFDKNGNRTGLRTYTDPSDPSSVQLTQYAYDSLDRLIRIVGPDSDDPIDGSGDGSDSVYDRTELTYDEHYNVVQETNPRGITFSRTFDDENRLTEETVSASFSLVGPVKTTFVYDENGQMTEACNDFTKIVATFDEKGWKTAETQYINLDGTGHTNGWTSPIELTFGYDCGGHRTKTSVAAVPNNNPTDSNGVPYPDILVERQFDALSRVTKISGSYFDRQPGGWAEYHYCGQHKWVGKLLANGAKLGRTFDDINRLAGHKWIDTNGDVLLEFGYGYDDANNMLHEIVAHDDDKADNYEYNKRYEMTGVNYRQSTPTDYRVGYTYNDTFDHDANNNRAEAAYTDPFGLETQVTDEYLVNSANEIAEVTRDGTGYTYTYDRCGNAEEFLCKPAIGNEAGNHVVAEATYDAYNRMVDVVPGSNPALRYLHDAFGRRSVAYTGWGGSPTVRRFVWEDWEVIEERILDGEDWVLERVHLNGAAQNERVLTAIDGDADFALGTSLNQAMVPGSAVTTDYEYYYLDNELYSVSALLDATDDTRVLEYYRLGVYGEVVVLPVVDGNTDTYEDTPLDLADNASAVSSLRSGGDAWAGRASMFENHYTYTGHRFDAYSGLLYMRTRYYEPTTGRFLSRDLLETPETNLYTYTRNSPMVGYDPMGTSILSNLFKNIAKHVVAPIAKWIKFATNTVGSVLRTVAEYYLPKIIMLLLGSSKQYLDYTTAFDIDIPGTGIHAWSITWQLAGGPKFNTERQKDHWVVQKMALDWKGFSANGSLSEVEGENGSSDYLEAWKVQFVAGWMPQAFRDTHSSEYIGPLHLNYDGWYRNFPQGDTWGRSSARSSVYGSSRYQGTAIWWQGKAPYDWKRSGHDFITSDFTVLSPSHSGLDRAVYYQENGYTTPDATKFQNDWRDVQYKGGRRSYPLNRSMVRYFTTAGE